MKVCAICGRPMLFKRNRATLLFPDESKEELHIRCAKRFHLLNKNYRPYRIKNQIAYKKLKKGGEISYEKNKS